MFLRCNNLTLEQYRTIALARGLTGGAGCLVSLVVLVIVLLVAKKKTWENFCKRIYFAVILYTLLYSIAATLQFKYQLATLPTSNSLAKLPMLGNLFRTSLFMQGATNHSLCLVRLTALVNLVTFRASLVTQRVTFLTNQSLLPKRPPVSLVIQRVALSMNQ